MKASKFLRLKALWQQKQELNKPVVKVEPMVQEKVVEQPKPIVEPAKPEVKEEPTVEKVEQKVTTTKTTKKKTDEQPAE